MTEKVKANKVAHLYLFIENTNSEGFLGAIRGVYGEGVDGGGYENTKNAESAHDGTGHMHFEGIEVMNFTYSGFQEAFLYPSKWSGSRLLVLPGAYCARLCYYRRLSVTCFNVLKRPQCMPGV